MKLKHLKSILDDVDTFDAPNVHLEQYPTPPDISVMARLLESMLPISAVAAAS